MSGKKVAASALSVLLIWFLVAMPTAEADAKAKSSETKLKANAGAKASFLETNTFHFSKSSHRVSKGGKSKTSDGGKKKKAGILSTVYHKGVKPLWDKNKGKLYCLLGKKLSIDGFCPPKKEEEKKKPKDEKKPKPPAKKQYTDESCIACLYVMEKLERIVARNPMDGEPTGPNNQNSFPGPASYNPAAYNAAQDINLAAPIPGPGYNSGMFLQVGEAVKCPPGMPFCRKALYRTGRRGAEREIARLQNQRKQKVLEADLDDGLRKIAGAMPPHYHPVIHNLQVRVAQVANQYLHDYSNEEICVDTSMCFAALLGTAPSKVFTRI